ncbi:MAG: efflux RND transporter periplasmic adaptor subunit [Sulfitobacter sp.]
MRILFPLLAPLSVAALALAAPLAAQEPPKPVKLMELSSRPVVQQRQFFGQVQPLQTVDLAFQVAGQIQLLNAEEGSKKPKGALIAGLDLDRFERAVAQAKASYDKAKRDAQRLSSLRGQAVSAVAVSDAETQLQLAEIALADAQDNLDHAALHAPFDALVARRLAANFTTVAAGTPVVRLHDMSELRVDIDVPEVLFRSAGGGENVSFEAELPGDPQRFALAMREFETETSSIGQTYKLTLAFEEDPGAYVLPGASATVYASALGSAPDGIILPQTALVYGPAGAAFVMVYEDGKVAQTPVEIELGEDGLLHMLSGPADGTQIVLTGASQLRDGQAVRPFTRVGE